MHRETVISKISLLVNLEKKKHEPTTLIHYTHKPVC